MTTQKVSGELMISDSPSAPTALQPPTSPSKRPLIKDQLELVRRADSASGSCKFEARTSKNSPRIKKPSALLWLLLSATQIKPIANTLSFDKGFFLCFRAIQMLKAADPDAVIVVGLAGPSGAGKTVFTEKTREFLPGCALLCMDMYNDGNLVVDGNFDDPRLTDYQTLLENIQALKSGQSCQVPIYDFKQSRRVGFRTVERPSSRVVLVEGIYALSDRLRPLLDLRVSVRGGVHLDLVKRVMRDVTRSGQAPEEIIQQISETVYPMYKAFIEPDLQTAHLKIINTFNPFSGFQSPTFILKSGKHVTEEAALSVLSDGAERVQEDGITDIYLVPPNEDSEACSGSWLRMRSRNGRYQLVFEEYMTDGPFIISPNIKFEVNVRILGGLMALGYTVATIMKRSCVQLKDDLVTVKIDTFEGLDKTFVQVQGRVRAAVEETARRLGLEGTFVPRSYIEQMQLEKAQLQPPEMPAEVIIRTLQSSNSFHQGATGAEDDVESDLGGAVHAAIGDGDRDGAGGSSSSGGVGVGGSSDAAFAPSRVAVGGGGNGHYHAANGHVAGAGNGGGTAASLLHQLQTQGGGPSPQSTDARAASALGPSGGSVNGFAALNPFGYPAAFQPPMMASPIAPGTRSNSFGAGPFPPPGGAYSRNGSLTDLQHTAPWPNAQLPFPLVAPGTLEGRFFELSARLDRVVEVVGALAGQVQQQHLQQQVMQQHASGLGGDHDALSRNASPAQRVFAARMDTIVRSLTNEAQSARDAFLREVAASSEGSNGNGGGGGGGSHGRGRGAYRQLQNGPGADRVWDSAATTAGLVRSLVEALARLIAAVSTRPLPEF